MPPAGSPAVHGAPSPASSAMAAPQDGPREEPAWNAGRLVPALAGLLVFAAVAGATVGVLWRWQLRAYPEWVPPEPPPEERGPVTVEASVRAMPAAPARPVRARLAIVIDDWGYGWRAAETFFGLDAPLTVAVIPFLPYSRTQALRARARGFEVLVHLPMQPEDPRYDPGPMAITTDLPDEEIRRRVELAVEAVPGAVGASNHMGSRATADRRVMEQVLAALARRGLFFLDSRTTSRSVAGAVARELGLPWAQNDLFLDGERDVPAVGRRIELGARRALAVGQAVVIGHVQPATAAALAALLPELRRRGVEVVPVSQLLQH